MNSGLEKIDFDVTLTPDNTVMIEAEGCSLISEYLEDKRVQQNAMNR